MVLILLFVSELLSHSDTLFPDQILQTVALFGGSSDDSGLILVPALRVHVVRFAVLVIAGLLVAAGRGC